jgi:hypothetical protein
MAPIITKIQEIMFAAHHDSNSRERKASNGSKRKSSNMEAIASQKPLQVIILDIKEAKI